MPKYHNVNVDGTPTSWWLVANEMLAKRIAWWAAINPHWPFGLTLRWITWPAAMTHDWLKATRKSIAATQGKEE